MQTGDGYLLGLHRLAWRRGEEDQKVNNGGNSVKKNVVYLHHGLLMNSEVWVCLTDEERCLPFQLVNKGYDVWVRPLTTTDCRLLTRHSWEITVEINTLRSQFIIRQQTLNFGTSQWMNSHSMTSQIALITSSKPHPLHHYPI